MRVLSVDLSTGLALKNRDIGEARSPFLSGRRPGDEYADRVRVAHGCLVSLKLLRPRRGFVLPSHLPNRETES